MPWGVTNSMPRTGSTSRRFWAKTSVHDALEQFDFAAVVLRGFDNDTVHTAPVFVRCMDKAFGMDEKDVDGFFQGGEPCRLIAVFFFAVVERECLDTAVRACHADGQRDTVATLVCNHRHDIAVIEGNRHLIEGHLEEIAESGIEQLVDQRQRECLPEAVGAVYYRDPVVHIQGYVVIELSEELPDPDVLYSHVITLSVAVGAASPCPVRNPAPLF
jgi:hypothetical protein